MIQLFFLLLAICLFPGQVIRSIQWVRAIILDLFFMTMFLPIRLISIFSSKSTTSLHGSQRPNPILATYVPLSGDPMVIMRRSFSGTCKA